MITRSSLLLLLLLASFCRGALKYSDSNVNFEATEDSDGSVTLKLTATVESSDNWIGLGVSKAGEMSDSEVYMGTVTTGLARYWSAGYSTPAKQSEKFTSLTAASTNAKIVSSGSSLSLTVTRKKQKSGVNSNDIDFAAGTFFIYGIGKASGESFSQHYKKGSFKISNSGSEDSGGSSSNSMLIKAHGILMVLAWMLIIPSGIFLARFGKSIAPGWFKIHRNMQGLGVVLGLVSFILILYAYKAKIEKEKPHHIIGVIVLALSLLEVCLGFYSNAMWKPGKPPHILHDKTHWWIGRIVSTLAIANCFIAFFYYFSPNSSLLIVSFISLGVSVAFFIYLSIAVGQIHEHSMVEDAIPAATGYGGHAPNVDNRTVKRLALFFLLAQIILTVVISILIGIST